LKIYKNLKHFKYEKEIILIHHLGLGDAIVCNGMVNYLSEKFDVINLVVHKRYYEQIKFLYSENHKIKLFIINTQPHEVNIDYEISKIFSEKNIKILKVGFENRKKGPFNTALYKQLNLDYQTSFSYFHCPVNYENSNKLSKHLIDFYRIKGDYILVHDQTDEKHYKLNTGNEKNIIKIEKETDLYKNIFLYIPLIKNAKEIHCVDSSFIHLVERIQTKSKLYYHTNRGSNIFLTKDWTRKNYES